MSQTASEAPTSRLMVLLFTDIVGSVQLKTRLGADAATRLISRHDELFRGIVGRIAGAEVLKDTGDGYLASFATASDAVKASLQFQWAMHHEPWDPEPIRVRIGLNIGQVSELEIEPTGRPKLSGLAVDLAARIMDLAQPSQLLMTRGAFDDARQYVREHPDIDAAEPPDLRWMAHGAYLFKGAEEPMSVYEVGAEGVAPLSAPPDSEKALRSVAAQDEETLGWRPAAGLPIPERKGWVLDHKLGEGGFGEVWLARHKRTLTSRVFKFCFDADRLRSLKRELTLFRLLREALGDRKDIARLYEVQLEAPPFYLESEFTEHGSLLDWAETVGGIDEIPFETRIELVTRTARAVAAAHSVGVLHKDIKPANVLVYDDEDGRPRPRLADFGIAEIADERLEGSPITVVGFSDDLSGDMTTTQMYAPPELLAGRPFTALGDVYALGVMLYQMVVGDLSRPLAQGWERDVQDPILRDDIAVCVEGDEQQRLGSAQGLAKRLETLPERRKTERRRRIVKVAALGSGVLAVLLAIASVLFLEENRLRQEAEEARDSERAINQFIQEMMIATDPYRGSQDVRVVDFLDHASAEIPDRFAEQPEVQMALRTTIGSVYKHLGLNRRAEEHLQEALTIGRALPDPPPELLARTTHELAAALTFLGEIDAAEQLYREALSIRRNVHDGPHEDVAMTLQHLGFVFLRKDEHETAEAYYSEALAIRRQLDNEEVVAQTLQAIAWILCRDEFDQALATFDEALAIMRSIHGDSDHATVATILQNKARCLVRQDRPTEAEPLYEEAIRIKRTALPAGHHSLARSLYDLARLRFEAGDPDGAEALCEEAVEIYRLSEHRDLDRALTLLDQIRTAKR